jgi:lipid-binding SYLF domain-containing protein
MTNRINRIVLFVVFAFGGAVTAFGNGDSNKAVERIQASTDVFNEIMTAPDKGIPRNLLSKAHCIVIVPSMIRGGFVVGFQYGVGVATCRRTDGGWSAPSTVRLEGGSFGALIGAGATDLVLMIMNEKGADQLLTKTKFTLGGEGAVMAGPLGRAATAETDALMRAEVLSYSRSRGVYAGIAIKGSTLRPDDDANRAIYGRNVRHEDILGGKIPPPAAAKNLMEALKEAPSES